MFVFFFLTKRNWDGYKNKLVPNVRNEAKFRLSIQQTKVCIRPALLISIDFLWKGGIIRRAKLFSFRMNKKNKIKLFFTVIFYIIKKNNILPPVLYLYFLNKSVIRRDFYRVRYKMNNRNNLTGDKYVNLLLLPLNYFKMLHCKNSQI